MLLARSAPQRLCRKQATEQGGERVGAALGRRKRSISARTGGEGEGTYRGAWVVLAVLAALVTGLLLGFGWSLDQQLQAGILEQRAQAAAEPDWVSLDELPPYLPLAFDAAADPTFQIRGAAGEAGTPVSRHLISQVYMLEDDPRSYARGAVLAGRLEQRMSSDGVIELFLNRARLGTSGDWAVVGVQQAAEEYFGKSAAQLTLGEAATLAGLLLSPRLEEPERYPGPAGARRNEILRRLHLDGKISDQELVEATGERLGFQPGLAHRPMTRPPGWDREDEDEVIRLPAAPLQVDED
jgi:hypothetical protein